MQCYNLLYDVIKDLLLPLLVLQICGGVDENAVGACSELIFASIDESFPDDGPLVPSGFRIIPLDSKSVECCLFVIYST